MLLKFYADESGVHGAESPITVLGGYMAPDDQWTAFDLSWRAYLAGYGVQSSHAKELEHSKGVFRSWPTLQKQAFLEGAARIIGRHGLLGVTTWFYNADYDAVYKAGPKPKKTRTYSKYGVAVASLVAFIAARAEECQPPVEKADLVLAAGAPASGDAPLVWTWLKEDPTTMTKKLGEVRFGQHQDEPGLQAADLLAYAAYTHITNRTQIAQFATMWQLFMATDKVQHLDWHMPRKVLARLKEEAFRLEKARMEFGTRKRI